MNVSKIQTACSFSKIPVIPEAIKDSILKALRIRMYMDYIAKQRKKQHKEDSKDGNTQVGKVSE